MLHRASCGSFSLALKSLASSPSDGFRVLGLGFRFRDLGI